MFLTEKSKIATSFVGAKKNLFRKNKIECFAAGYSVLPKSLITAIDAFGAILKEKSKLSAAAVAPCCQKERSANHHGSTTVTKNHQLKVLNRPGTNTKGNKNCATELVM